MKLRSLVPDFFTVALILAVVLASLLPCYGLWAEVMGWLTNLAIALLFFLHGAKLSAQAVRDGLVNWRLHLTVLACTFVVFPLLGLLFRPFLFFMDGPVTQGFVFVCLLPSTVQSSIAFTSIARGNVPAAICSASISSLAGIFITPLLSSLIIMPQAGLRISWDSIYSLVLLMLLPFVLGQLLRGKLQGFLMAHRAVISVVDQGSILLIVYTAFSSAVIQKLWSNLSLSDLLGLVLACCLLLTLILLITAALSKWLGFTWADRIAIIFCGSKKSLATGVPMLGVLFGSQHLGLMVLPIMIFHQIQLMVCAFLAPWFARMTDEAGESRELGQ